MKTVFANEGLEYAPKKANGMPVRAPRPLADIEASLLVSSLDCLDAGIVICDATSADCPIIFASKGFAVITQYTPQEVFGRKLISLLSPETAPAIRQKILQSLAGRTACREEFR